jgi:hypothetical protein
VSEHPIYSPDLNPCDFGLFGLLNGKLQEQELSTSEQIIEAIPTIWDVVFFDDLQSVFQNAFNGYPGTLLRPGECYTR